MKKVKIKPAKNYIWYHCQDCGEPMIIGYMHDSTPCKVCVKCQRVTTEIGVSIEIPGKAGKKK